MSAGAPAPTTAVVTNFRLLPEGRWQLGVVVKRSFRLEDGRRFVVAERQVPPEDEEATAWKPATDVVVRGSLWTYASNGREAIATIEIGPHRDRVRATGDRVVTGASSGRPQVSEPEPFESMPLTYERCYGGFDRGAYDRLGDVIAERCTRVLGLELDDVSRFTYPRNRRGVGFYVGVDADRLKNAPIPNLDDPDDPVEPERLIRSSASDWLNAPVPVALDWIEPGDFPRSAHWGYPPPIGDASSLPELRAGTVSTEEIAARRSFPSIPTPRALCGTRFGHSGLRLHGGEEIRLDNLHASWRQIRANLPREAPAIRLQPPGCPWFDLEPQLDTVVLDLDAERLAMVWSAKLEVAGPYPEEELALTVTEVRWP